MEEERTWPKPKYRYKLRGLISLRGFRSVAEFARRLEVPTSQISRVVGGWEVPSESFAKRIAEALQVDLGALNEALHSQEEGIASSVDEIRERYASPNLTEFKGSFNSQDVALFHVREIELLEGIEESLRQLCETRRNG